MKRSVLFTILLTILTLMTCYAISSSGNQKIKSFSKAKKFLHNVIFQGSEMKTFYCGCIYDRKLNIDHSTCGYIPGKEKKRAGRVEWEHIVPASVLGGSFKEWKEGSQDCVDRLGRHFKGRKCASKMNNDFQLMHADMYNLVPASGEINAVRSDLSFGEIAGEKKEFGKCDFETDGNIAEPADRIKGDIARIYQYMDFAYPFAGIINEKNRLLFEKWAALDPADEKECRRGIEIEKLQGNVNPVLKKACSQLKP